MGLNFILSFLSSDDFAELAIQTDQFAQRQAKNASEVTGSQLTNLSPDALTGSSRSSSYSSIVSSSSGDANNGKAKGDKRFSAGGFTPFDPVPGKICSSNNIYFSGA